jgi:hypothetical protein
VAISNSGSISVSRATSSLPDCSPTAGSNSFAEIAERNVRFGSKPASQKFAFREVQRRAMMRAIGREQLEHFGRMKA